MWNNNKVNIFKTDFDFEKRNTTPSNTPLPGLRTDIKNNINDKQNKKSFRLITKLLRL